MSKEFKLKRTVQCKLCPWKVSTNPNEIPREYDPEKHRNLECTIAKDGVIDQVFDQVNGKPLHIMACHDDHEAHCIGWLWHQIGDGNNIRVRMAMRHCTNFGQVKVVGPQHERFEDTLPK